MQGSTWYLSLLLAVGAPQKTLQANPEWLQWKWSLSKPHVYSKLVSLLLLFMEDCQLIYDDETDSQEISFQFFF